MPLFLTFLVNFYICYSLLFLILLIHPASWMCLIIVLHLFGPDNVCIVSKKPTTLKCPSSLVFRSRIRAISTISKEPLAITFFLCVSRNYLHCKDEINLSM